jgi:kynurenine 3-monooxygenase
MMRNVVIAGAGPAGLLLAALLMQRNRELSTPLYNITIVDNRQNLATFTEDELKKSFRSWMLGLAGHGCEALRTCTGLYEEYARPVGIQLTAVSIHIGAKEIKSSAAQGDDVQEALIIDRNFIVVAISRFVEGKISDNNVKNGKCTTLYEHQLMYVDYENRRVMLRTKGTDDFYIPYDLLVGCDGIRSCVRESLVKRHNNFEMDVGDIFNEFKVSLHYHLFSYPFLAP